MDEKIADQLLRVIAPAGLEAACEAREQESKKQDDVLAALHRDFEAALYSARRAERQFNAADPENWSLMSLNVVGTEHWNKCKSLSSALKITAKGEPPIRELLRNSQN